MADVPARITGAQRVVVWLSTIDGTPGCWIWPGAKVHGYGRLKVDGQRVLVHRLVYAMANGPIPAGLQIDHQCHNVSASCSDDDRCPHRACANPAHLEAVTGGLNTLRGHSVTAANKAKTHCPAGHPYAGDNLYTHARSRNRQCREGRRAADRRRYWKARGVPC